jgi:glycosyltransferase involved in cell wall biosynthesis
VAPDRAEPMNSSEPDPGAASPPLISVVIPTLGRPKLVLRAIASVLSQTYKELEVFVVVDGPDQETCTLLSAVTDPRLFVLINDRSLTAAGARNRGVAASTGAWIAFLDDDDTWMPEKLERQLAFALVHGAEFVSCLSRVVTPYATYVWPECIYDPSQRIDEYMFDRATFFAGSSFIQTSSYLIKSEAYARAPFRTDTPHDDWDLLLRQVNQFGVRILTVPEILVTIYTEEQRASLSGQGSWRDSLAWLETSRPLITRRAYSGFCLCVVGPRAAQERDPRAFFRLLGDAFRRGSPRPRHLILFLMFWAVPQGLRRRLRARLRGGKRPAGRSGLQPPCSKP